MEQQTSKADATKAMIDAAPAMLEALVDIVCCPAFNGNIFDNDKESHRVWTIARLAIARARGEVNW